MAENRWHLRWGDAAGDPWHVNVTPERAGWRFAGLRILHLPAEGTVTFDTGPDEMIVLPLTGACVVTCGDTVIELAGRPSVFAGVTDFAYLPIQSTVGIRTERGGRFALPTARATASRAARYGPAPDVQVELRGAGAASRQINNFAAPDAFECDRLVAVEVLTPGGNWSSYPPHKHDEQGPDEAVLEEIYYFEVRDGGFGFQRVYSSGRPIDVLAEVHTGDVVLVPHGYHGPSMAAPGYDLYYLNVLAGPAAERTMAFRDDPLHTWIRDTWSEQPIDPRLPFTSRDEVP